MNRDMIEPMKSVFIKIAICGPSDLTEPLTARVFLSPVPRERARALGDGSKTAVIRFTLLCEAEPPPAEPPGAASLAAAPTALACSDRATQVELSEVGSPVTASAPPDAELPPPPSSLYAAANEDMPAPPPPLPLPRSSREGFSEALRRYEARRAHAAALARLESAIDGFSRDAHTMLAHRSHETDETLACDTLADGAEMDNAAFSDMRVGDQSPAGSAQDAPTEDDEDADDFEGSDYEEEEEAEEHLLYDNDELAKDEGETAECIASGVEREEEQEEGGGEVLARDAPAEDEMSDVTDELSYLPVIDAPDLMAAIVKAAGLALAATSEDGDDGEQSEAEQPHVVHFDATMPALEPAIFLAPLRVAFVGGIASSLRVALADVSLGAARAGSLVVPVRIRARSLVAAEDLAAKITSADELVPREQFGVCTVGSARVSLATADGETIWEEAG